MTPTLPLKLIRLEQNDHATFGLLQDAESKQLAVTLEPPDRHNERGRSCIPAGSYVCRRAMHHGQYEVFEITGVKGRTAIHIHIGNVAEDTQGCPLLGTRFGPVFGEKGVLESKKAFDAFMASMAGVESFTLDVCDPFPVAA